MGYYNLKQIHLFLACSDYIGIYNGLIRDDQMSASSSRSKLTLPVRARLGNNASDRKSSTYTMKLLYDVDLNSKFSVNLSQ